MLAQKILVWNIKALALTVQKLWSRLMLLKNRSNSKVKVTVKIVGSHKKVLSKKILMPNIKADTWSVACISWWVMWPISIFLTKKYSFALVINKSHNYFLHVFFSGFGKRFKTLKVRVEDPWFSVITTRFAFIHLHSLCLSLSSMLKVLKNN